MKLSYLTNRKRDDTTLREWRERARVLVSQLLACGVGHEQIESLQLVEGKTGMMMTRASPTKTRAEQLMDMLTLARLRYLIEHHGPDCHADELYKKIRDDLDHEATRNELKRMRPLAETGSKVVKGGMDGSLKAHGTDEQKRARWMRQKNAIGETRRQHPDWPDSTVYADVAESAKKAGKKGWSARTLLRVDKVYLPGE